MKSDFCFTQKKITVNAEVADVSDEYHFNGCLTGLILNETWLNCTPWCEDTRL